MRYRVASAASLEIGGADRGTGFVHTTVIDEDTGELAFAEGIEIGAGGGGQDEEQSIGQTVGQGRDIGRFAILAMAGGVEHEIVIDRGQFHIDAADDFADVTGIDIGDDQTDNLGLATGQSPRLAIDDIADAIDDIVDALAGFIADIALVVDDPGNGRIGDLGLAGDVFDSDTDGGLVGGHGGKSRTKRRVSVM